jgi:hypothetical protein
MRRFLLVLPLLAAIACSGGDREAEAPPPPADSVVPAPEAATSPASTVLPPTNAEVDSADSADARDLRRRMATRETYAGCMRKIAQADQAVRAALEAVCRRSPGAPR